jgi:hypothetical protein
MAINTFSGGNPINSLQAAGKNKILNSDFSIWQRGTSFSAYGVYWSDRWTSSGDRTSPSFSQQTFTPGTAPVAGYEGQFYARWVPGSSGSFSNIQQRIEDVRNFAGQTVTLSYWARISTGTATNSPFVIQNFGSGGSGDVSTALSTSTITTTWTRFSQSFTIPSVSGKTIGTSSYLAILPLRFETASTANVDVWGVQLELGTTATTFQTATGTIQGELAACQRYLPVMPGNSEAFGYCYATNSYVVGFKFPVTTRVRPTGMEVNSIANSLIYNQLNSGALPSAITLNTAGTSIETASILVTGTGIAGNAGRLGFNSVASIFFTGCEL